MPAAEHGLLVCADTPFGFTLLPHSDRAIAAAAHYHELIDGSLDHAAADADAAAADSAPQQHLTIDHAAMGVGGDVSWLRSVRPAYHVPPGRYRWSLLLRTFSSWPPPLPSLPADVVWAPGNSRIAGSQRYVPSYVPHSRSRRLFLLIIGWPPMGSALFTALGLGLVKHHFFWGWALLMTAVVVSTATFTRSWPARLAVFGAILLLHLLLGKASRVFN